jgi:hypothetical protein
MSFGGNKLKGENVKEKGRKKEIEKKGSKRVK